MLITSIKITASNKTKRQEPPKTKRNLQVTFKNVNLTADSDFICKIEYSIDIFRPIDIDNNYI